MRGLPAVTNAPPTVAGQALALPPILQQMMDAVTREGQVWLDLHFLLDPVHTRIIDDEKWRFVPHATVSEDSDDELVITDHPVEHGSVISDHAFKRPSELKMVVGWSASGGYRRHPAAESQVYTDTAGMPYTHVGSIDPGITQWIYGNLLSLQMERRPFTLITGKRRYVNMLIQSLRHKTDRTSEFSFMADITFREVLLVGVANIAQTQIANAVVNLGDPESNRVSVTTGQVGTAPTGKIEMLPNVQDPLFGWATSAMGIAPETPGVIPNTRVQR